MAASKILMIRPVKFGYNAETAVDNTFQKKPDTTVVDTIQAKALEEFNTFVSILVANGIDVLILEDTVEPVTPDSIFPNNWISFHADGTICLFPMFAKSRRLERKSEVLETIQKLFKVTRTVDLTKYEDQGMFLEGTGSMVLDRSNSIVYASRSTRTNEEVLQEFVSNLEISSVVTLESHIDGKLIYHTNVMMCVGDHFVVICLDAILNSVERQKVLDIIETTGKEVVRITLEQVKSFAGNMLQVQNSTGQKFLVMSTRAYESLSPEQILHLEKFNQLLHSDLTTIEDIGGGSARCMMAEVYLMPN